MLIISIKAEPIFHILGFTVTNSYLTSLIVLGLLFLISRFYFTQLHSEKKSGFFYFIHFFLTQVYTIFKGVLGDKTAAFFPIVGAFFFFILLQNWFGLLPGVGSILIKNPDYGMETQATKDTHPAPADEHIEEIPAATVHTDQEEHHEFYPLLRAAAADLNTTLALGLISVAAMQIYGVIYLGWSAYLKKYLNFSNPINFFLGILEVISEFSRVISFSFRLFGNVFAGEVLLLVIAFLVPVLASFPFVLMEIFVGLVQALVFSMLTAVFLNMAVAKHH